MRIKKILLLEDYYDSFSPFTKENINNDPNLRKSIENNEVTKDTINIADPDQDFKAIEVMLDLTKDISLRKSLYLKSFNSKNNSFYGKGALAKNFDEGAQGIIIDSMLDDSHTDVKGGNSPLFEFAKRLIKSNPNVKFSHDLLFSINSLLQHNDIGEYDLIDASWIISPHIYREKELEDQIYKIKLYIFLNNSDEAKLDGYRDQAGKSLPQQYRDWDFLVEKPSKELERIFSLYSNRKDKEKSKSLISLNDWVLKQIDATKDDPDPTKRWENNKLFPRFQNIIMKSSLKEDSKSQIVEYIKSLFNKDNMERKKSFFNNTVLKENTKTTDYDIITNAILNYISKNKKIIDSGENIASKSFEPNSTETFNSILEKSNLTKSEAFGKLRSAVIALDKSSNGKSNYIDAFKKLNSPKNKNVLEDLYKAKIKITSKGGVPWKSFIKNFLDNVNLK